MLEISRMPLRACEAQGRWKSFPIWQIAPAVRINFRRWENHTFSMIMIMEGENVVKARYAWLKTNQARGRGENQEGRGS